MIRKLLLPLAAALLLAVPSSATILILSLPEVVYNETDMDWTWTYEVTLGPGSTIDTPADPCNTTITGGICDGLLTIYDFYGYVGGTVATSGTMSDWTAGTALLGVTPVDLIVTDNGLVPNLTFAYTGGFQSGGATGILLGEVSARSIYGNPVLGQYAGRSGTTLGLRDANVGITEVPNIPEPGTVTLFGGALLGLAALRRRRRS